MVTVGSDSRHACPQKLPRFLQAAAETSPNAVPLVIEINGLWLCTLAALVAESRKCPFQCGDRLIMVYVITDTGVKILS